MWNLEPSGKVMNVEVVSFNNFIKIRGMIDLRLIGLKKITLILREVMIRFFYLLWGSPSGPFFGRVNLIGLWICYGTLLCKP